MRKLLSLAERQRLVSEGLKLAWARRKERANMTGDLNIPPADWAPHMGNNHLRLPFPPSATFGGAVSFRRHLGKPLSQALWDDLRYRFGCTHFCVYRHNEMQWTMGWGAGHVTINLDESDNVFDVQVVPYVPL